MNTIISYAEEKMNKTTNVLVNEYASIRAGRANPAVLDKVTVEYYGVPTPVNQLAAVSVPEARTLLIQPWDKSSLKAIEKAIQTSDIGINPQNDGGAIRLNFPPLTEERRLELVKGVYKHAEDGKIAIRSIRRDAIDKLKEMKKKSEITEDDLKSAEKKAQDLTDRFCKEIDGIAAQKEKEILEI
ncbi:MAG TPA: ribosome recycling factor [Ruminococcaceae bacterium]|jgi:ribosome recycling factor|nr:ribosome recycling factor [Oscillospiraceae bacterium]HCA29275.1 ribosome recycling factor [Oscillospiraceae bacterium]